MTEYGLFNSEGMVEGQFWSRQQAYNALHTRYDDDDELEVLEVCSEHEGQPAVGCEECEEEV